MLGAIAGDVIGSVYEAHPIKTTDLPLLQPRSRFTDVTCQGTVPEAIVAFLDSQDYEDAVRLAISLGGDSDTLVAITGGIAQAFYGGVPEDVARQVRDRLPGEFLDVSDRFNAAHGVA